MRQRGVGGAALGSDAVLQFRQRHVLAGGQPCRAAKRGHGQAARIGRGKAKLHRAFFQGGHEVEDVAGTASRHGGHRVDHGFAVYPDTFAHRGEQGIHLAAPTLAGVFGMARTMRAWPPSHSDSDASSTPAAMLTTVAAADRC
ncbi:hypothetical protein G6F24_016524 [Rhizopus arrhizus]|nr:hypothetical protein G6F24_016524 [Rhizopus arrhizus]